MLRTLALAAVQTVPVRGDVDANLAAHLRLAERAAAAGARIVVFPELSLTGYELDLAAELAFSADDHRLAPLIGLATARATTLVVGAPVRLGERLHIGAFLLAPDGDVGIYTKHHLGAVSPDDHPGLGVPPPEATVFEAGTRNPLVDRDGLVAAVAVCADTGHPSHAACAADRGARAYLASMFVTPGGLESDTARLQTYAREHAMAIVFSNYGGPSGGLPGGGRSGIWSDRGEELVRLSADGPGIALAILGPDGWRAEAIDASSVSSPGRARQRARHLDVKESRGV